MLISSFASKVKKRNDTAQLIQSRRMWRRQRCLFFFAFVKFNHYFSLLRAANWSAVCATRQMMMPVAWSAVSCHWCQSHRARSLCHRRLSSSLRIWTLSWTSAIQNCGTILSWSMRTCSTCQSTVWFTRMILTICSGPINNCWTRAKGELRNSSNVMLTSWLFALL